MLLNNTTSYAKLSNGEAVLNSVEPHLSASNNLGIKLVFANPNAMEDTSQRHTEYISLSQADRLSKTMRKIVYLFKHSSNQDAINAFMQLPIPFADVQDANGNVIRANNAEEIKNIKASNPEIEFIATDDKETVFKAVKFTVDKEQFQSQLLGALKHLESSLYELTFVAEKDKNGEPNGFNRLRSISPAKFKA